MIEHTVVFRLAHDEGSAEEGEFLAAARATLTAIPGVTEFVVNRQVSPKSDFDFQFSMAFSDTAAYAAYDAHPTHVEFVRGRWIPEVSDFQEFDFLELDVTE